MSTYKNIGKFIKSKREDLGITQEELSNRIGVSSATISLYESGDRKPEIDVLRKLSEVLECSLVAMLDIEVKDVDLDLALRSENLNENDIQQVRQYIKTIKYARDLEKANK